MQASVLHEIPVNLVDKTYSIYIGQHLLSDTSLLATSIVSRQVMIVTNQTIAPLYLPALQSALREYQCDIIELPDGEQYKTMAELTKIFQSLLEKQHHRDTTLIALGGGVIGDMTGFAAACYQRGVNFIQIPTTLLAQVDASVGGKTAVNLFEYKNMVGAFHQPKAVIIDISVLKTLPRRELMAGFAEVIKYGLIQSATFFAWLVEHADELMRMETNALAYAIAESCRIKAEIVSLDEKEQHIRALLNLGHTYAHAIEAATQYKQYLHGEAVAIGMCLAARYSQRLGYLLEEEVNAIIALLKRFQLPTELPSDLDPTELIRIMRMDKKATSTNLRMILLKKIGNAFCYDVIDENAALGLAS